MTQLEFETGGTPGPNLMVLKALIMLACDPADDHHFNPGGHKHGMMSGAAHAGDMPNLHVPQSGELVVEILNPAITLEKGKPNSVFDADGSAVAIHAKADDYKSDPVSKAYQQFFDSEDARTCKKCGNVMPKP